MGGFRLVCPGVKAKLVTTIPTFNNAAFIRQTLESLAAQTRRPDRVVILDDGSTDDTREIVENFADIHCEFIRNPADPGLFQNFNRCLAYAPETEFLQILHADDVIEPTFYEQMTSVLAAKPGRGMAWCLDVRIDECNQRLSLSGTADGKVEVLSRDTFLKRKAEIGNQAFCATLLKTDGLPAPCQFPLDFPILGDMVFWAAFGAHCAQLVHVCKPLAHYRWHGDNATVFRAPNLQSLISDEWRTMETNELLRGKGWSWFRKAKLKGLLAVRSNIKAKRVRQNGNPAYSREIIALGSSLTGRPLWLAGKILVELRDLYLFGILRRPRHPKNIYG